MTTLEIEGFANEEGLVVGSSDINLKVRLRRKVIPKFEMDVGECAWRRVTATLAVTANDREYDLPANFGKMLDIPVLYDAAEETSVLTYLGEDTGYMSAAIQDTDAGTPAGYWITRVAGPPTELRAIYFDKIPDQDFTLHYVYLSELQFADDTTSVDLSSFIPKKFHWGLVVALKKEIYKGRISIDDPRLAAAQAEYDAIVDDAITNREPGMRRGIKRIKMGPM